MDVFQFYMACFALTCGLSFKRETPLGLALGLTFDIQVEGHPTLRSEMRQSNLSCVQYEVQGLN